MKKIWYSDKFCVEPHRNIESIAQNTVCHIFLCGLYLAPPKLSEQQLNFVLFSDLGYFRQR